MTVAAIQQLLPAMRDIDGVGGSFIITDEGVVAARDLTALLDDAVLAEVAPRLARLHETLSSSGDYLDTCLFSFADQKLFVRRLPNGFLGLLLAPTVNLPALRMAANLVARRVGGLLAAVPGPPQAAEAPQRVPSLAPESSAPAAPPHPRAAPTTARAVPRAGSSARPARIYRGSPQR